MKDTDRRIQEAIEIGHANKRVVELVENWCTHVKIERSGGVGIVEQQTGLPIGMRHLTCPYAQNGGFGAMDLEAVAIDFHDRNCVGCNHRQPVRLPNLSELIGKRDDRRALAQERAQREHDAERAAVAQRAGRRVTLSQAGDAACRGILARVGEFDTDPTPERAALLVENARTIPDKFDSAIRESLIALIEPGGARARTALEVLSIVAKGSEELADAALRMLAMREAPALAAEALGDRLKEASSDQIKAALPALFELAVPLDGFGRSRDGVPEPLLAAWVAAPDAVRDFIKLFLRSDAKHSRIIGCRIALILLEQDAGIATEFAKVALLSVGKPDDSYGPEGSATNNVVAFLGASLCERFDDVDALLQAEWTTATEEQRSAVVGAYLNALKHGKHEAPLAVTNVHEKSFERVVAVVSARILDDGFRRTIEFLRYGAKQHPGLVQRHSAALLGAAALLINDIKDRYSPLLDPRPTMLKAIEADSRRTRLRSAVDAIMDLLGHAGAARPDIVGELVIKTFQNLHEGQEDLRAALMKCLGQIGQSRDGLAPVLPAVYSGMMAREQVVRAAGASAYADLAERAVADLPRLMHETFLLLIQDPFVIVHAAAVHALRRTQLPKDLKPAAIAGVWLLIDVHGKSREYDWLTADCIETFLKLIHGQQLPDAARSILNPILSRMPSYIAARLLVSNARELAGVPEYGDAVIRVLLAEDTIDSDRDDLLMCIGHISAGDIARLSRDLVQVALMNHPDPSGPIDHMLELVIPVAGWDVGVQIAKAPLRRLSDVPRDRPLRRLANARLITVQFEAAIARGAIADALALLPDWSGTCADIESEYPTMADQWSLLRGFGARVRAVIALDGVLRGHTNSVDIAAAAAAIKSVAMSFGETDAALAYGIYGKVLAATGLLLDWAQAVRTAEQDADRYLRAAKQACKDLRSSLDREKAAPWHTKTLGVVASIGAVAEIEAIQSVAAAVLAIGLPLPLLENNAKTVVHKPHKQGKVVAPCVVFVCFTVDGVGLSDPHVITPDELHDLDVTVRVSRWPAGAHLILDALTVEPQPAIGELPKFRFEQPQTATPYEVRQNGRMLIRVRQPIAARPLEFVYRAYFEPEQRHLDVVVEGERRIRVRSYDPARNPVTGYQQVDLKLLEIRDKVRSFVGVQDKEIDAFLLVLAALGQTAGEALQDNTFPGQKTEAEFQQQLRGKLRANPRIGADLQEHAQVAGGITDFSYGGIPVELKVEPKALVVADGVERYSQQAAQYTAGNDRRMGILTILDCSPKTSAPGSATNDIFLRVVQPPGGGAGVPLLLGVVIIRGNLRRPSDLSK
ncbi:hypothetical protein WME79_12580 [Sorangium sp. So ce726]|uniref:hypothetical protein n=1 Tax=Sorangium sp. So ce726 TaxID=3133319 RepID=UPI003F5EC25D